MTGTPIENRLSELWSIFDYLMPGFLYGYQKFREQFELPIVRNGDEERLERLQKNDPSVYSAPSEEGSAEGSAG